MLRFRQVFQNQHVVLPVIHVDDPLQALRNATLASDSGSDGVFLINHSISHEELMQAYALVTKNLPDLWVGINSLGSDPLTLEYAPSLAGVWADNAGIDEDEVEQPYAAQVRGAQRDWNGLYFGGVAFKYQRPVANLEQAMVAAAQYMDVVTTSGAGTGSAASISKIQKMKLAHPEFPLAIASGITPENVSEYLPFADCFLVATGISKSFTELDPVRVGELIARVRGG